MALLSSLQHRSVPAARGAKALAVSATRIKTISPTWCHGPMANPDGRPRSETVKLTKTAGKRFSIANSPKTARHLHGPVRSRHEGEGHCGVVPPRYSPFAPSCSTSLLTMRRIACWRSGGWARSIAVARTAPSLKAAKTSSGVECRQNCGTMLVADAINPALANTRWVSAASAKRKYGGAGGRLGTPDRLKRTRGQRAANH